MLLTKSPKRVTIKHKILGKEENTMTNYICCFIEINVLTSEDEKA
jgi:hypothetical protein